jgi:hypothetical protein
MPLQSAQNYSPSRQQSRIFTPTYHSFQGCSWQWEKQSLEKCSSSVPSATFILSENCSFQTTLLCAASKGQTTTETYHLLNLSSERKLQTQITIWLVFQVQKWKDNRQQFEAAGHLPQARCFKCGGNQETFINRGITI